MVFMALVASGSKFRRRRGVWFIENVAGLMRLIQELEVMSHHIHSFLFSLHTTLFWKYLPFASTGQMRYPSHGFHLATFSAWFLQPAAALGILFGVSRSMTQSAVSLISELAAL